LTVKGYPAQVPGAVDANENALATKVRLVNGYKLLTLDAAIYKASFPRLEVITV
jgi:hypothetical protein